MSIVENQKTSIAQIIRERRSIKRFNGELVDEAEIVALLEDAVWAPNHGKREPWRFVIAAGEGRERLLEVLQEVSIGVKALEMSPEALEKAMDKFTKPGAYLFVVVNEDARQKQRLEDFAAASTLVQNFQLLAWEKNIGVCWKTPAFIDDPKFREKLGVKLGERIIGMIQIGRFDEVPAPKERTPVEEKLTRF